MRPRPLAVRLAVHERVARVFVFAANFELIELAEVAAGLHQVPPAAEALAFDVQLRESRRAARAHVDGEAGFVVAAIRAR